MGQAKQRGTYEERVQQAKKQAKQQTKNEYANISSSHNQQVLNMLNDPTRGFFVQHKWQEDKSSHGGKLTTYTIYAPSLDEKDPNYIDYDTAEGDAYDRHLDVYKQAFGMVESASYNAYVYGEQAGKNNPYTGEQTYEPFGGGTYRLMIGVVEHDYKDGQFNSKTTPFLQTAIFPLLQHGWEPDQDRDFGQAYGDKVPLNNLQSMIARSNFSTKYTTSFNPNRVDNVDMMFKMSFFSTPTTAIKLNWLNHYEESYWMGRSLWSDNIKTLVGDSVTKDAMNLHSVFD